MVLKHLHHASGLSLRAGGRGFSPATKRVAPCYFLLENRTKIEPKEIPSHLIPRLLVVFTRQLEILVTTLETALSIMENSPGPKDTKLHLFPNSIIQTPP